MALCDNLFGSVPQKCNVKKFIKLTFFKCKIIYHKTVR